MLRLSILILLLQTSVYGASVVRTTYTLYKFQQRTGTELATTEQKGDTTEIRTVSSFTDRATTVPLASTLVLGKDGLPQQFRIWGKAARQSEIDESVSVSKGRIEIQQRGATRTVNAPSSFFFSSSYAPVSVTEQLFRYWSAHGRPASLTIFPGGNSISFVKRGEDQITNDDGKPVKLQRWALKGIGWGRETVWFDDSGKLAAFKAVDAEFDHFEAARSGYTEAIGKLVASAAADGMESLREASEALIKSGPDDHPVAYVGATLIDGTSAEPIRDSVVVVRADKIIAAGPRSKIRIPRDARKVHLDGKTLLPGLWDMHAHFEQVEWGPVYLAAGVTTVRDAANEMDFIRSVRDTIEQGRGLGPRLLLACIVDGEAKSSIGINVLRDESEVPALIKNFRETNCAQVKIYSSLNPKLIAPLCKAAHEAGMSVTGHIPNGIGAVRAVAAGMDQINHIVYLARALLAPAYDPDKPVVLTEFFRALQSLDVSSPEAKKTLAFFVEHHTVVDPTLALYELMHHSRAELAQREPGIAKVAPQLSEQIRSFGVEEEGAAEAHRTFAAFSKTLRALHEAGIVIVAGTDQAVPGHSIHRELELYVEAGFTPMEAIQSATIVPARVMKRDQDLGTIEAGKIADMIIVNGNPLADIHAIRNVVTVIYGGRAYDTSILWKMVEFTP